MATYTDITYHIVFGTKRRARTLDKPRRDELYKLVWGVIRKRNCHLYRIGGIEDHMHILTSLHPSVTLADLIKEVKLTSAAWIKGEKIFPFFEHWQDGYGAFTVNAEQRPSLIEYIKNQEQHHQKETFVEELKRMVEAVHLQWKAEYLP